MQMGADRIHEIVLSLRNFSRVDDAQMKPVNIHEGLDNTILILHNRLKPSGNNPGIMVVKEYGDLPLVECYYGQLNQVFMNIISNAIDSLENHNKPTKSITISTSVFQENLAQDYLQDPALATSVVIRIRDNGIGMAPSIIEHLFEPFFTTKPVGKGTGLGLSISHQIIVEKHGGILQCSSEPGQGTEFWIQIPITPPV
jgi:two-component system NtrC family sensor kinase